MGNRAVITTKEKHLGIYLHWNGGRDSVEVFLKYCKIKGYRPPSQDCYGWARLAQVVGNFFGGTDSIGIDTIDRLDTKGNNGTYIIEGWEIVGREYFNGWEQDSHTLQEMLIAINKAQPKEEQIPQEYFTGTETPTKELVEGDKVLVQDFKGKFEVFEVVDFGKPLKPVVNGHRVNGVPYVNRYLNDGVYDENINNYLTKDSYIKI